MKFYETHFEEYINEHNRENLYPKLNKIYEKFPKNIHDLKNLIFFIFNKIMYRKNIII
jgi:hypothetical protein